jgi:hypothetical protein
MFPIPLPWLIVGVLVSLFGTYRVGHHYGWLERDGDMKIAIAQKNEESRKTEQQLNEQINQNATKLLEATNAINQKTSALAVANRAGKLRLNTASCVQPAKDSSFTSSNSEKTGGESSGQTDVASDSERATIEAIAEIVAQGDRNTAQLNACIDAFNEARDLINGKGQ